MSEETRKAEQIEQERKASELAEQNLDEVVGGTAGDPIQGIDVNIGKKGRPKSAV